MIIKNDFPILEYDTEKKSIIMPDHEGLGLKLPERGVLAFLSERVEEYARDNNWKVVANFDSITKPFPLFVGEYKGVELCLIQAPCGASAAVQFLDWMWAYGVTKVISSGSCGVLTDIEENRFLIPHRAIRDEGASYHYLSPSRYVDIKKGALKAIEAAITEHGLDYEEVITWTTDGFYRETKDLVDYRREEGCTVVEMECAALAACAEMRGMVWGEILYTADTLADAEKYDERNWGHQSKDLALELCLDAVIKI